MYKFSKCQCPSSGYEIAIFFQAPLLQCPLLLLVLCSFWQFLFVHAADLQRFHAYHSEGVLQGGDSKDLQSARVLG